MEAEGHPEDHWVYDDVRHQALRRLVSSAYDVGWGDGSTEEFEASLKRVLRIMGLPTDDLSVKIAKPW